MNDYQKRQKARDNALDECGIGSDVQNCLEDGGNAIAALLADVSVRCQRQLAHDLLTNAPCGIDIGAGDVGEHAVKQGLVSAIGKLVNWDIYAAREMCALILEDVNDHTEAAAMFEKAKGV